MITSLRPYLRQIKLNLQNLWVYKWDFFGDFIRMPVTIAMHLLIFLFLYSNTSVIQGFTRSEGITYILIVSLISRSLSQNGIARLMENKIVGGELTMDLTIPVEISFYVFSRRMGFPIYLAVISIISYIVAALIFPSLILVPSLFRIVITIIFALTAMIIQMQVYYMIGLMAFWLRNIGFITNIASSVQGFLGGRYFPLSWLPAILLDITMFLPFIQMYYIPAIIFLNKETIPIIYLIMQLFAWLISLQVLIKVIENKGLQKFEGEGG